MKIRLLVVPILAGVFLLPAVGTAQLGGRPAEEWAITLESGRRMEGLEIENVVRELALQQGDVVADIGAGTGIFSIPIAMQVGPSGAVLAVEVDEGFLPMIEEKASAARLPNVDAVLGEFGDPRLPRRDVDVAFFHDVLHHVEDRAGYLRALAAYMAPGSRIAVVDFDANHPSSPHQDDPTMLLTPAQVDGWMEAAGFERSEEVDLFEEKFFVIYTKRS
jgi:cyclopropane fatty-acyl-phospholipid synthase-like methyltransferase